MSELLSTLSNPDRFRLDCVLHLGAGMARELDDYLALKPRKVLLVEAHPELARRLSLTTEIHSQVEVINRAVAEEGVDRATLHVLNDPLQSSLLAPAGLLIQYPNLRLERRMPVLTISLAALIEQLAPDPRRESLLIVDVQGSECSVLRSAPEDALQRFSWVLLRQPIEGLFEDTHAGDRADDLLERAGFQNVAAPRSAGGLPFRRSLYYRDGPHHYATRLAELARDLRRKNGELEQKLSTQIALTNGLRTELQSRQTSVEEAMSRAEKRIASLEALLLRDDPSRKNRE